MASGSACNLESPINTQSQQLVAVRLYLVM
jgi:hypothetical protein